MYRLYPALKDGTRDMDMPDIESSQILNKTGIRRFCLQEIERSESKLLVVNLEKKYFPKMTMQLNKNRKVSQ